MKTAVLFGIALLSVTAARAQTSAPAQTDRAKETVTLTGCVAGSASNPITLTQAMVVPGATEPGQVDRTPSPIPAPVSSDATQQPAPVPTGTSGVASGTAPAGSSGASLTGYRLSGADMKSWLGQRVQVIGRFVPSAPQPAPSATVTGAAAAPPLLEFKVETVKPASGACPK